MYHGPVAEVAQYFAGMGFYCPERKGVADFLQEVTSRKDQEVSRRQHSMCAASTAHACRCLFGTASQSALLSCGRPRKAAFCVPAAILG